MADKQIVLCGTNAHSSVVCLPGNDKKMKEQTFACEWLGRTLTIKTGRLAGQADAALTVQYGDTVVLATVVEAKEERGVNYFPLMVEFDEKLYAAGIIKGSRWIKREGRPTDESILAGRMIDRSIRPLFQDDSKKDVQVVLSILSVDQENDHDVISLIAASAALSVSGLNWLGPIGGIRIGRAENQLIFNPTYAERKKSDLDLIVVGSEKRIVMIEAGGQEIKEDDMFKAIMAGQKELQAPIKLIKELKQKSTKPIIAAEKKSLASEEEKQEAKKEEEILDIAGSWLKQNTKNILFDKAHHTKGERKAAVQAIKNQLDKFLFDKEIKKDLRIKAINSLVEKAVEAEVTQAILKEKKRVDGRKLNEIRPLSSEISFLPRTHGSSIFSRGETQSMSVVTLGGPGLEQELEGIEGNSTKRFMHHYNFPSFSVGETGPMRGPSRRDIGHGALAEKALMPLIPTKADFPYTIRVVSETMSSNGSSSMASVCSASMALMDAGCPIKKAAAGIAIGLASNEDMSKWEVLTDLQDLEDGKGGMDLKIAGTKDGITAIQMDTKTIGLTEEIVKKALEAGLVARLELLKETDKAIDRPKAELSPYAPRVTSFQINPEKIREVIGPGGKIINEIIDACEVEIDIDDDGLVYISGTDAKKAEQAVEWVKSIVREVNTGEMFQGKIVRMLNFGVFVEILPGKDGMVHVSELAPYRVEKPEDFLKIGDQVHVKVKEIDEQGRVNLTMLGLPENQVLWQEEKGKSTRGTSSGSGQDRRPDFNRRKN